jgi:VanZ like family/Concanavalin A-like lectin/glucanases superfamily
MNRKTLITILFLLSGAFIVAGLWPFNFHPDNRVMLLPEGHGLRLAGVGNARTQEPFSLSDTFFRNRSFTLEMLVRPHREPFEDVPSMVSVCDGSGIEHLFIGQWKSTLIIRTPERSFPPSRRYREIGVANALHQDRTRLITVTATEHETAVFLDGERARTFSRHSLLPGAARLTGYLVIGNAHPGRSFWSGDLRGLRIYDRALQEHEVRLHAREWSQTGMFPPATGQDILAAYDFDRRDAPLAVNRSGPLPDLVVARAFQPVRRTMLELPWERDWRLLPDAMDVLINIAGFIPFGFFFSLLLRGRRSRAPGLIVLAAVGAGSAISLAIEVTQAYLPMMNSSATDLLCNIFGTFIGAMVLIKIRHVPDQLLTGRPTRTTILSVRGGDK